MKNTISEETSAEGRIGKYTNEFASSFEFFVYPSKVQFNNETVEKTFQAIP